MRRKYVVSYDISDPKRLNRVYRKMRGYGDPIQYSVFFCELSDKEKIILISELNSIINNSTDNVYIFDLASIDSNIEKKITMLGSSLKIESRGAIII